MAADGFATLQRKVQGFEREWSGEASRRRMEWLGVECKKDATEAVVKDLGDQTMSGWWKPSKRRPGRKPVPIVTGFELKSDTALEIEPKGKSKGPWRVLEEGRKASKKGDVYQVTRRYRSKRTGEVSVKTYDRKRKRTSGATGDKNTWTEATDLMRERLPKRSQKMLNDAMRRHFSRR